MGIKKRRWDGLKWGRSECGRDITNTATIVQSVNRSIEFFHRWIIIELGTNRKKNYPYYFLVIRIYGGKRTYEAAPCINKCGISYDDTATIVIRRAIPQGLSLLNIVLAAPPVWSGLYRRMWLG